jgi:hypothetical protein
MSEYIHHGVHPSDVNTRVMIAAALTCGEMKSMSGVEVARAGAT